MTPIHQHYVALSDLPSGGNPQKHQSGQRPAAGPPQQGDTGPGGGAEEGQGAGGAPGRDQQRPAVCQDEAGGGNRSLPAADSRHDGRP